MTIMLAYQAAGAPKQTTPLGSFENWSRRVRDAVIWAGLEDPCKNAEVPELEPPKFAEYPLRDRDRGMGAFWLCDLGFYFHGGLRVVRCPCGDVPVLQGIERIKSLLQALL
jgi:hypothetical protein